MLNIELLRRALWGVAFVASGASTAAVAQDIPGTMIVRATVAASCSIDTIDPLNFGTLVTVGSSATTQLDAQADLTLTCSDGSEWTVHADGGLHDNGGQRRVANASATTFVNYNLALDAGQSTPIPTTAGEATATLASGSGTDAQQIFTIYGRVPSGQAIPQADAYSDVVVFTVSF